MDDRVTGPGDDGPRGQPGRTTVMADVAAMAGVSQMTVSRVMNGTAPVAEATRRRVLDAMDELDYRPNAAARALVTGRSRVLGVVGFNTTLCGPAPTLFDLQQAARAAGYFVSVAGMRELDQPSIDAAVGRLRDQGVDGLVVMTPHPQAVEALSVVPHDLPTVTVLGESNGAFPAGTIDQVGGARLAETDVTAVFVGNDPMALGLYRAVREAGLSIPDDISVVGFDDVPEAAFYSPPLTTVRQDFDEVGKRSLRVLLAGVEGTAPDVDPEVPVTLVERASTASGPQA